MWQGDIKRSGLSEFFLVSGYDFPQPKHPRGTCDKEDLKFYLEHEIDCISYPDLGMRWWDKDPDK
jgi:hypothetical protein